MTATPARRWIAVLAVLASAAAALPGADAAPAAETAAQKQARMAWWTEARFGMFIHWGLYALPARHEWVKNREKMTDEAYRAYFERFDPDLFEPRAWARAARDAGMKYVVITSKHHEGFCLWDSAQTDYKATRTPHGKDLLRPFLDAVRAEGLRVGLYYSLLDWHHPDYTVDRMHPMSGNAAFAARPRDYRRYVDYLHAQVRELLTGYGTIDCLFMDFSFPGENGKGRADWRSEELLAMIRSLQPGIVVNDRLDLLDVPGGWDFRTPEQVMPREWVAMDGRPVPWETCQTFSGSWGYHRDESTWKSVRQLVTMLAEVVSKGGNLLLNVGPTARGTFDDRALERLAGMGRWMRLHDRAITGCTQAPAGYPTPANALLTHNPKSRRLYVHILEWPAGAFHLDGFAGKVDYAQLLNDASEIRFSETAAPADAPAGTAGTLTLRLPIQPPDVALPVIELFLK